jgi:hypothetical protein
MLGSVLWSHPGSQQEATFSCLPSTQGSSREDYVNTSVSHSSGPKGALYRKALDPADHLARNKDQNVCPVWPPAAPTLPQQWRPSYKP